jgi:hypothetical protein
MYASLTTFYPLIALYSFFSLLSLNLHRFTVPVDVAKSPVSTNILPLDIDFQPHFPFPDPSRIERAYTLIQGAEVISN